MKNSFEGASQNIEYIDSIEEIKDALVALDRGNYIIVHQTSGDVAEKIMNKDTYFSDKGLTGTADIVSPSTILNVMPDLDKPSSERTFLTHKGSNALVIMAFPKSIVQSEIEAGRASAFKGLRTIDDIITDKLMDEKIEQQGLPTSFIFGYYYDGRLVKNNNFNPDF